MWLPSPFDEHGCKLFHVVARSFYEVVIIGRAVVAGVAGGSSAEHATCQESETNGVLSAMPRALIGQVCTANNQRHT